jgi:hypothetical protein
LLRYDQSLRLLTIAAAASGKPRTSGLTAAPSHAHIALAYMRFRYVRLIRFSFLILIGCFATLEG